MNKEEKRRQRKMARDKLVAEAKYSDFVKGNIVFLNCAMQALINKGVITAEEINDEIKRQTANSQSSAADAIISKVQSEEKGQSASTTDK